MSHIQEIEKLFDESVSDQDFEPSFMQPSIEVSPKQIKLFLRQSHLKYLQSKKKELEGEFKTVTSIVYLTIPPQYPDTNSEEYVKGYNLAKQEEIDKLDKEIKEI